jgi:hypothetical protein
MVVFPDWPTLRQFVALASDRRPLLDRITPFDGPFATQNHLAILVADKATGASRPA